MPTEKPRYTITVDPDLQKAIEDYQFANRFKSQTKAIISLMEIGLNELRQVTSPPTDPICESESQLLSTFRSLNNEGKEKVLDYIEDLAAMEKYKNSNISQMVEKNA